MKGLLKLAAYLDSNFNSNHLNAANVEYKVYNNFNDLVSDHIELLNAQYLSDDEWTDKAMIVAIIDENADYALLEEDGEYIKVTNV